MEIIGSKENIKNLKAPPNEEDLTSNAKNMAMRYNLSAGGPIALGGANNLSQQELFNLSK